jgi:hypothetical protein
LLPGTGLGEQLARREKISASLFYFPEGKMRGHHSAGQKDPKFGKKDRGLRKAGKRKIAGGRKGRGGRGRY